MILNGDKCTSDFEKGTLIQPNMDRLAHLLGEKVYINKLAVIQKRMRISIIIIFFLVPASSFSQDYLNYSKRLLISSLLELGFDTLHIAEKQIITDSVSVTALFNQDKCTRLEYFINKEYDVCDSITYNSSCQSCFESSLRLFLNSKRRNWRKYNDTTYYSVNDKWKSVLFGPPRQVSYSIVKLALNDNLTFSIYRITISKEAYTQLRKMKKYR